MNFPFVNAASGSGLEFAGRMKQGTFLIVDDFDSMRKVTINQLKQLGAHKLVEAANGAEALRVLSRQPITMVLSDWNMPVMTGLDLLLSLMKRAGRAIPREALLSEAGRADVVVSERTVDVHISRLRTKLGEPSPIKTIRGVGYLYAADDGRDP